MLETENMVKTIKATIKTYYLFYADKDISFLLIHRVAEYIYLSNDGCIDRVKPWFTCEIYIIYRIYFSRLYYF